MVLSDTKSSCAMENRLLTFWVEGRRGGGRGERSGGFGVLCIYVAKREYDNGKKEVGSMASIVEHARLFNNSGQKYYNLLRLASLCGLPLSPNRLSSTAS